MFEVTTTEGQPALKVSEQVDHVQHLKSQQSMDLQSNVLGYGIETVDSISNHLRAITKGFHDPIHFDLI